jgi:hypothetical protein
MMVVRLAPTGSAVSAALGQLKALSSEVATMRAATQADLVTAMADAAAVAAAAARANKAAVTTAAALAEVTAKYRGEVLTRKLLYNRVCSMSEFSLFSLRQLINHL